MKEQVLRDNLAAWRQLLGYRRSVVIMQNVAVSTVFLLVAQMKAEGLCQ